MRNRRTERRSDLISTVFPLIKVAFALQHFAHSTLMATALRVRDDIATSLEVDKYVVPFLCRILTSSWSHRNSSRSRSSPVVSTPRNSRHFSRAEARRDGNAGSSIVVESLDLRLQLNGFQDICLGASTGSLELKCSTAPPKRQSHRFTGSLWLLSRIEILVLSRGTCRNVCTHLYGTNDQHKGRNV